MKHQERTDQDGKRYWKIPHGLSGSDWELLETVASEQELKQGKLSKDTKKAFIKVKHEVTA